LTTLVKGLSLDERIDLFNDQLAGYSHLIETDYNRFDRSISLPILQQMQDFIFLWYFRGERHILFRLALELARITLGVSDLGVRYKVDGTRCSGDAHTSIGNGLINSINTFICFYHFLIETWTSLHEGDDGIIGVTEDVHADAVEHLNQLPQLGFSVKAEIYNQIEDSSFCGRHFYLDSGFRIKDHADILRSLNKFHTSVSNCKANALLLAKAMSYYHTDGYTPLIGPLCHAIIHVMRQKVSFSSYKRAQHQLRYTRFATMDVIIDYFSDSPLRDITTEARVSCARRTGITIEMQLELERRYLHMIEVNDILVLPRIHQEWLIREDGHVFGDPAQWVRTS